MDNKKTKVAIYCRLSEEDKDKNGNVDSRSIVNQKSMLIKYARDNNWDIYDIYSDDDYTGADRARPDFNRLLNDAKNKKFNIVLCKSQSRFTRELELVEKYIHGLFPIIGIRFIGLVDNADTDNKGNKKSRQINGLVNEWYLEDMSENIKSVLTDRRKQGYHIGAYALYGYKKDPNLKGHLLIDENAAKVVREVFELFSEGYGKSTIARILNERGIPNPTEYKRQNGLRYKQAKTKNSTLWKYFAISNMLTNEMYIGNMVQGKYGSISYKSKKCRPRPKEEWYIVEHTHEPIIDMDLWNKVQSLIQQKTKPCYTGNIGLFARKVTCMNCGYTMQSGKSRGKHNLRCPTHKVAKDACIGSFIMTDTLEKIIVNEINNLSKKYLDMNSLEKNINWQSEMKDKKQSLKELKGEYEKKINEYTKCIRESYLDKVKGIISENDYIELSKDLANEREKLDIQILKINKELEKLDNITNTSKDKRKLLEHYTNVEHLNRDMLDVLIESISVGKRDPITKELPVKICWKI